MADAFLDSDSVVSDEESFYNIIRTTGNGMTPFWDSLNEGMSFEGNPKTGHVWYQEAGPDTGAVNAHLEGSIRADVEKYAETELRNHVQILKRTYGITKSEKAASSRLSKTQLERSKEKSYMQLRLDVEYALLSATAPVQRVAGVTAGKMGGLRHYISMVIDGANLAAPDYKLHIEAPLKAMWQNGVLESKTILCGVNAKSAINTWLDTTKQATNTESKISRNVSEIEDAGWATNVQVKASTFLATNEIIIYAPELIHPVLLRQEKDNEVSDPKFDAEAWENLFEMTVQIDDPYAAVWIKNLLIA